MGGLNTATFGVSTYRSLTQPPPVSSSQIALELPVAGLGPTVSPTVWQATWIVSPSTSEPTCV
jgi:hypothetical protein